MPIKTIVSFLKQICLWTCKKYMFNVETPHKPFFHVYFYNIRFYKGEKGQGKIVIFWEISENCNYKKARFWVLEVKYRTTLLSMIFLSCSKLCLGIFVKELSLKLGKYWQKALNLLEIYHSSKILTISSSKYMRVDSQTLF